MSLSFKRIFKPMTKLLDLDSILPPKKSIKFGGQEYPIVEMTVGLFVSIKQMEGKDLMNMSPVEQVTAYADLVRKVIPSVPDEVLEKLTVPQLQQIFTFAMEVIDEENEKSGWRRGKVISRDESGTRTVSIDLSDSISVV